MINSMTFYCSISANNNRTYNVAIFINGIFNRVIKGAKDTYYNSLSLSFEEKQAVQQDKAMFEYTF